MQLSHLSTGPCDLDCVRQTWEGPEQRLRELATRCGAIDEGAMADIDDRWFYFSCGNREGMPDWAWLGRFLTHFSAPCPPPTQKAGDGLFFVPMFVAR